LDTTRSKNAYHKILGEFENRKIDILVGTQMISKGLDFDNVSIVGILNADNMLNFPDFRAFERSYQLMAQVSGRSGRSEKQGKVIIQTSDTKHKIIGFLLENNYDGMFLDQIKERQKFKYPPFYRIIELTLKHKKTDINNSAAQELSNRLRKVFGNRILGPHTPVISRIQNYYLQKITIKIESDSSQKKAKELINQQIVQLLTIDKFKALQVSTNVDPQ
jgi:primosomal protein N' (replication factor Y) (superfamily II helicase)